MLKAFKAVFGPADDEERDASGKPKVTLAKALQRNWLELWYQPKVSLQNNSQLLGAEGLIRVRHPELGVLAPFAFLPGASEADMHALTERVILRALEDWCACADMGAPLKLSINVPASAFVKLPIARMLREQRPRADNWPGLILEVTEDEIVNDLQLANDVADELVELGCSLAIDDFGAGYSSLARLRQLPFSELKIDRAYVTDCNADKMKSDMLEVIMDLARRSGLKTVAEGIETSRESHKLQALGCDMGQGYLFAKPMPRDEFIATWARRMAGWAPVEAKRSWWRAGASPRLKTSG